jgi:hypothetical protein
LNWFQTFFDLIDLRSFSNLWFWIVLAIVWSMTTHRVMGVPFDLLVRAQRQGGQAAADLEDMVRINVMRWLEYTGPSAVWLVAAICFALTTLIMAGFIYGFELAQAVFLLVFPLTLVMALNVSTARQIRTQDAVGDPLYRLLNRHRMQTQIVGLIAIFVTTAWGMYQNISQNPLGG